jgi:hypothetical protein
MKRPDSHSDYFARVRPLLGDGLRRFRVAASELPLTGRVVELLAGCMLRRVTLPRQPEPAGWPLPALFRGPALGGERSAQQLLVDYLRWKNPAEPVDTRPGRGFDLRLRGEWLPAGSAPRARFAPDQRSVTLAASPGDLLGLLTLSSTVAWRVRELLLGRKPWPSGTVCHGSRAWPFSQTERALPYDTPSPPTLDGAHLMVIGCGSLGSEAARLLVAASARSLPRFTLIDPGRVSAFNPSRQWFGGDEVGQPKVVALRRRLRPARVRAWQQQPGRSGLARLRRLLREDRPDAVLLATGTSDHPALAELLFAEGIPHLCACAYPRARFFEVGVVLPDEGTPCLSCFRGQLGGAGAAPPLDDELAHFLYRQVDELERARLYRDLVAEPASCIETARPAEVAARVLLELLRRRAERSAWLARLLADDTTWLLGSSVEEPNPYGLTFAGQVVRLGLDDLVSFEEPHRCPACGRERRAGTPLRLPSAGEAEVDAALLGAATG